MFAFKIIESEIKGFMNKLLREDTFHRFEVRGIEIAVITKFQINGILDKDFVDTPDETPARHYCMWPELQTHVFNIIKGNKRPKLLKITFSLPAEQVGAMHKNASAFFLNITFEAGAILCATATSEKNFTMDKSVDAVWEEYIKNFTVENKISVSTHI